MPKFQCSPDKYDGESTGEIPPRLEFHSGQELAAETNPKAVGNPELQRNDPTGSPRVTRKTIQAAAASTPKGSAGNAPVTSYTDSEV